jgi:L-alanine-DL-glutamate epimerase-like enolase superfamily enzyme
MRAWSAIDISLWDVAGKLLDRPLYTLLGGRVRDSIEIYATCANAASHADQDGFLERPADLARELLATGITAMKIWPFDRFAPQISGGFATGPAGWSAMGPPGHTISARDLAAGVQAFEEIRDAVGSDMALILEGHSRWDVTTGIRILRALEDIDLLWAEDVIQPDSVDDLRRLVEETDVPQAVSERLITRHRYREVLERQAAHVVMLDVAWTGGVTESAQVADLADLYHLPFAPHDCTGPVTALVNLHLCMARSNAMITEIVRGFVDGYYLDVIDLRLPIVNRRATAPSGSGLGATLRDDFRARSDVSTRQSTAQ